MSTHFLLPFTQNIDLEALAYAMQFAKKRQATLVPLALIPLSEQQWAKEPRLEAIEQANDFLEAVKDQAALVGVEVELCAMETYEVVRSISLFAQEMLCEGILLFLQSGTTVLLPPEVVKRLFEQVPCTLCLVRLHPTDRTRPVQRLLQWGLGCICRKLGLREEAHAVPDSKMMTLSHGDVMT